MPNAYLAVDLYHLQLACLEERETVLTRPWLHSIINEILRQVRLKIGGKAWFDNALANVVGGKAGKGPMEPEKQKLIDDCVAAISQDPMAVSRIIKVDLDLFELKENGRQDESLCDGTLIKAIDKAQAGECVIAVTSDGSLIKDGPLRYKDGIIEALKRAKVRNVSVYLVYAPAGTSSKNPRPCKNLLKVVGATNIMTLTLTPPTQGLSPVCQLTWLSEMDQAA